MPDDNIFAPAESAMSDERVQQQPAAQSMRPDNIPEKFWDASTGSLRTDALLKSYGELERRFGDSAGNPVDKPTANVPESADGYSITPPEGYEELLGSDPDVNARLHKAGFTQEQAALVYELAAERLIPLAQHVVGGLGAAGEAATLAQHFGGEAQWQKLRPQIEAWGKSNLGTETFNTMAAGAQGVIAMHRMMQSNEPSVLHGGGNAQPVLSESALRQMMQNPRYWRDQDPTYVAEVQRGFEALYPN
nr:hypothetical protein 2 [bacterium]